MIQPPGLQITEFKGLNTYAPKGVGMAPCVLENVWLDRAGGYSPMRSGTVRQTAVTDAVSSGKAQDLFLQKAEGWGTYKSGVFVLKGTLQFQLSSAAVLGSGVVNAAQVTTGVRYYLSPQTAVPQHIDNFLVYWNGTGSIPTVPYWMLEGNVGAGANYLPRADYVFTAQTLRGQSGSVLIDPPRDTFKRSNLAGFQKIETKALTVPPPTSAWWPVASTYFRVRFGNMQGTYSFNGNTSALLLRVYTPGGGRGFF